MASEVVNILLNLIDNATNGIDKATSKMDSLAGKAKNLSSAFAPVSLAAGGAIAASVKFAADYDKAIQGAVRGLDLAGKDVDKFKNEIRELSKDLKYQLSSTQLAGIATEAGKLGIARDQIDDYTKSIVKMAVATDQLDNVDKLSTNAAKIMNVFKLNTKELNSYLAAVNKLDDASSATSNEILNFTQRVAGIGKTAKLSANELSAWGATLISAGNAPNTAATFMNKFLTVLGSATNLSEPAQRSLEKLGYSAKNLSIAFDKNASKTMQDFINKVKTLDTVSQREVLGQIFGQEHVDSAMLLMSVTDQLGKNIKFAGDSAGNAAKLQNEFNKSAQSFSGLANTFKNQVQEIGINLGTILLPGLIKVMGAMTPFINSVLKITETNPQMSTWIVTALGITALISPMFALIGLFIKLIGILGSVASAIGFVAAIAVSAPALALAPWISLGAGIAAAAFAIYKHWGAISSWFNANVSQPLRAFTTQYVKDWQYMIASINGMWGGFLKYIGEGWKYFKDSFNNALNGLANGLNQWINNAYNSGRGMVKGFIDGIYSMSSWAQQSVGNFMKWLGQFFPHSDAKKGEFRNLTASGIALGETFLGGLSGSGFNGLLNDQFATRTPALSPSFAGSGGGSSSSNVIINYEINSSNNDDLIRKLKQRDQELINIINSGNIRVNRQAY
jgi:TP901 family phage tail tape measure protein